MLEAGHHQADLFYFPGIGDRKRVDQFSRVDHCDAIGQGEGLFQIAGHQKNAGPLAGLQQQVPDFFGGPDIKALGGLFSDDQARTPEKLPGQNQLLQVAA